MVCWSNWKLPLCTFPPAPLILNPSLSLETGRGAEEIRTAQVSVFHLYVFLHLFPTSFSPVSDCLASSSSPCLTSGTEPHKSLVPPPGYFSCASASSTHALDSYLSLLSQWAAATHLLGDYVSISTESHCTIASSTSINCRLVLRAFINAQNESYRFYILKAYTVKSKQAKLGSH